MLWGQWPLGNNRASVLFTGKPRGRKGQCPLLVAQSSLPKCAQLSPQRGDPWGPQRCHLRATWEPVPQLLCPPWGQQEVHPPPLLTREMIQVNTEPIEWVCKPQGANSEYL